MTRRARVLVSICCAWLALSCTKDAPPLRAEPSVPEAQERPERAAIEPEPSAEPGAAPALAPSAEGPFAFLSAFERERVRFEHSTPRDLAARAPAYQAWSMPRGAVKYFDRIDQPRSHGTPVPGAGLNADERAALEANGFVVSQRLGDTSYAGLYHRIYELDQPVLITADSVLHAWHMSYDAMLESIETQYMSAALDEMLSAMAAALSGARTAHSEGTLALAVEDADVFVAIARSLLKGESVAPTREKNAASVRTLLDAIKREQPTEQLLFGRSRRLDFSQMKPRGHYEKSEPLKRYFRTVMWLGRTELELGGASAQRELAIGVVLYELLERGERLRTWRQMDALIQTFIGLADSMDVTNVGDALRAAGMRAETVRDAELTALLQASAGKGVQHINSQLRDSDPDDPKRASLPSNFTFFPQRFTVDSWALGQMVFDRILFRGQKVERHIPSGVDVAFSVLGNDDAAPILARRIEDRHGRAERDGLPFQANLLAARSTIDGRPEPHWDATLYDGWLGALRALSVPTAPEQLPKVMRTEAWAARRMQTQLASWAELRHDTILYVKQSYGFGITCEYPAGFVELQPAFWERMERSAKRAAEAIRSTPYPERIAKQREHQAAFFDRFSKTMGTLRAIVDRELKSQPLGKEQLEFLKQTVEVTHGGMCGEPPRWDGWYIQLYYLGQSDALKWDALVADVHSSPEAGVLHVATGSVDRMVAIIDRGGDTMAFAGPVAQYFELQRPLDARLRDSEWKKQLREGNAPPRPEWTQGWVVSDGTTVHAGE